MKPDMKHAIFAALFALLALAGCGGGGSANAPEEEEQPAQEEASAEPVSGEFVGFARDAQGVAGIAAIADPVPSEGGARDVKVYYCDGAKTAEWFRDSADGNSIDFTSDDHRRLSLRDLR